jgi:lipopolysaccharide/colanic/teichoic acid biosynthesis glycosyltransferase
VGATSTKLKRESTLAPDFLSRFSHDPDPKHPEDLIRDLDRDSNLSWLRGSKPAVSSTGAQGSEQILRIMDILLSSLLLALLSPFLLLLILAIKIESPGPSLFNQWRVGKDGVPFLMFKFRSMEFNAKPRGISLTERNDARVTRIGRFIRRHHIDEALQFFNVLRGEMSIVGPRPEMPAVAELSKPNIPGYSERQTTAPGITGLAQILNGYDDNLEGLRRTVALDSYWIRHRSPQNYLKIMLKTIPVVLRGVEHA